MTNRPQKTTLSSLAARAVAATSRPEPAFCLECRLHPELEKLIGGYRCKSCKRVWVALDATESEIDHPLLRTARGWQRKAGL